MILIKILVSKKMTYSTFLRLFTESGRLFVWGNNQYGQLGVMGPYKEIVTKPSLVRQFKYNKLKVKDVAFGYQFTVVLTGEKIKIVCFVFKCIYIYGNNTPITRSFYRSFGHLQINLRNFHYMRRVITNEIREHEKGTSHIRAPKRNPALKGLKGLLGVNYIQHKCVVQVL